MIGHPITNIDIIIMENQKYVEVLANELMPTLIHGWRKWLDTALEISGDGVDPEIECDEFTTKILAAVYKVGRSNPEALRTILNDKRLLYESYAQLLASLMVANNEINDLDD